MEQLVFELDKQTQLDLAIFPDSTGSRSILSLFEFAVTIGGQEKLTEFFKHPLTNIDQIEERLNAIKYIAGKIDLINLDKGTCDYMEFYLSRGPKPASPSAIKAIERKIIYFLAGGNDFYVITSGIQNTLQLLNVLHELIAATVTDSLPKLLKNHRQRISEILDHPDFSFTRQLITKKKFGAMEIAKADYLFRYLGYERLKELLDIVYQLDVFNAAAKVAKSSGYSFPVINRSNQRVLKLEGMFHPFVIKPVANGVTFNENKNICFVTGANMAGKSTFLKSIGIAVYLSQIGFPVPASYMETSVFDGLITTINLSDNIQQGNSHFYTEVSRVKNVAQQITRSQNIVVIFDELFRGTNVKDAFDASLSIISAFSKLRKSFFVISTHIIEVANELLSVNNINFKFMETTFNNDMLQYSYKLQDGITEERLGMWIVQNEGIVEIIESIAEKNNQL